jgi:signal transduction histidine kinase
VEQTVYFACVEGMTNVAKHSGSDRCRIEVSRFEGSVVVRLSDVGRGGADPAGGGLNGLRERLQLAGGSLTVSSRTGSAPLGGTAEDESRCGTLLTISLPIRLAS